MNSTKILSTEIQSSKVSSLPTRPTSPTSFGGSGYTGTQLKAAFDRLPLLIAERFNALLDDITAYGDDSLSGAIPTGIKDGHTLASLFSDIKSGVIADYLTVGGESLTAALFSLGERISALEEKMNEPA